jgi:hypothetical protein
MHWDTKVPSSANPVVHTSSMMWGSLKRSLLQEIYFWESTRKSSWDLHEVHHVTTQKEWHGQWHWLSQTNFLLGIALWFDIKFSLALTTALWKTGQPPQCPEFSQDQAGRDACFLHSAGHFVTGLEPL